MATHVSIVPPYPEMFPAEAARVVLNYLRGSDPTITLACLGHSGWAISGFGMGQLLPDDHPPTPGEVVRPVNSTSFTTPAVLDKEALADQLESVYKAYTGDGKPAVDSGVGFTFDWRAILTALAQILLDWLTHGKVPV